MEHVAIALGTFFLLAAVPITAIITHHQRKMAEITHGSGGKKDQGQKIARLEEDLMELRHIVAQQAIALDDVNNLNRRLLERQSEPGTIQNRLQG